MSNSDQLAAIEYEAETNWAENVSTFATHRIAPLDPIDTTGLEQNAIDAQRVVQTLQGGTSPIRGPKGGSFKIKQYWTGHGSTTAGATTLDAMETWKGFIFGNPPASTGVALAAASGTTAAAGSTTTSINTVASGTIARGSLIPIGSGGLSPDGRASGQFYAVNNHTATVLVPRNATITALNAGDVIYSAANYWFAELASNSAVKGLRYRFQGPNQKYEAHGCYPTGLTIAGLGPGEIPTFESTWGTTWWDSTSGGTFPSAVTSNQYQPAPIGGGSMIIGDVGSTTRTAYDICAFSVNIQLGLVPMPGHATVDPYSRYIGARRVPTKISCSFTIYAEATGTNTFEGKYLNNTSQWFVWSGSTAIGSRFGIHAQNCKIKRRPVEGSMNGLNTVTVEMDCFAGTTDTTTDQSQAALVIAEA